MKIVGNGRLFTRDNTNPYYENGAVLIEGNLIKEVGSTKDLKSKYPDIEFIDAKGQVIMPAFINTHHHIYSAFARGISINNYNPSNFLEVLDGMWYNIDNHMNLKDTSLSAKATLISCIENGVTTVFDHHASYGQTKGSLMEIAKVAQDYGIRSCLCYEVSDRHGTQKMEEAVQENVDFIEYAKTDQSDMIKGMMGLHASFTLSDESLKYAVSKLPKDVGFHVHVSEGYADVEDSLEKYGMRPVQRLEKLGVLGPKTLAIHCIHIDDNEMNILKATDTMVVHNPESNMGNAVGCPDTLGIYAKGITYGLGTDGYTSDMCESYKVANILHKHNKKNPNVAWVEIPTMLFENNVKIANRYFKTPLGMIKEGYAADIIIVDYDALTPMNADNLNSHILFGVNGNCVTSTICNGKVLMQDRKLIGINKREVLQECVVQAEDLWKRVNTGR